MVLTYKNKKNMEYICLYLCMFVWMLKTNYFATECKPTAIISYNIQQLHTINVLQLLLFHATYEFKTKIFYMQNVEHTRLDKLFKGMISLKK